MILTLPIPGFVSVIGFAVIRLPGDGAQFAPGLPPGLIDLPLFLLGKLLVRNEFLHTCILLLVCNRIAQGKGLCKPIKNTNQQDSRSQSLTQNRKEHRIETETISFYNEHGKITLGCYASFGDYLNYNLDFDGSLCHDGIEVDIFSSTKTQVYKFGVCWLDVCTKENEAQTWFGADPGICGF